MSYLSLEQVDRAKILNFKIKYKITVVTKEEAYEKQLRY